MTAWTSWIWVWGLMEVEEVGRMGEIIEMESGVGSYFVEFG